MTGQPSGSSRNKVLKMSLKKLGWYLQARSQSGLKFTSRICGCITRFPGGTEAWPVLLRGAGAGDGGAGGRRLLRGAWPEACSGRGKTGAASNPGSATSHHTPLRCLIQWDPGPPLLACRAPFLMSPLLTPRPPASLSSLCSALQAADPQGGPPLIQVSGLIREKGHGTARTRPRQQRPLSVPGGLAWRREDQLWVNGGGVGEPPHHRDDCPTST